MSETPIQKERGCNFQGWGPHAKRMGVPIGSFKKKPLGATRFCFVAWPQISSPPITGTNSKVTHYMLSLYLGPYSIPYEVHKPLFKPLKGTVSTPYFIQWDFPHLCIIACTSCFNFK